MYLFYGRCLTKRELICKRHSNNCALGDYSDLVIVSTIDVPVLVKNVHALLNCKSGQ